MAIVNLPHAPGNVGTKEHPVTGETALFIPKGFDPSKPAVLIPYFHGHTVGKLKSGIPDALERQKLAEMAAKSGKNVVFVIPQMGDNSDIRPEFQGKNASENAQKFLDEAADGLTKLYMRNHPNGDAAESDKISKAFHEMPVVTMSYSGGYQAAWSTLSLPRVKGAVMLDSMYTSATPFVNFSNRPDGPFVAVRYGDSTKGHAQEFLAKARKGSYSVQPNPVGHIELVENTVGGVLDNISVNNQGQVTYTGLSDNSPLNAQPIRRAAATTGAPKPAST